MIILGIALIAAVVVTAMNIISYDFLKTYCAKHVQWLPILMALLNAVVLVLIYIAVKTL